MRHRAFAVLAFAAALATFTSCRKGTTIIYDPEDGYYKDGMFYTLAGQWQYIWRVMDNSYVFWDIDRTDWDALYDKYLQEFKTLDRQLDSLDAAYSSGTLSVLDYAEMMSTKMKTVTDSMLSRDLESLTDQHFKAAFYNRHECTRYAVQPSLSRLKRRSDYHPSLTNRQACSEDGSYTGTDYVFDAIKSVYGVTPRYALDESEGRWAYSCSPADGIFYLRLSGYYISNKDDAEFADTLLSDFFNNVAAAAADGTLKGIILDNRGNPGGYGNDFSIFPGKFIHESVVIEKQKTKNGLGRFDYSPWSNLEVKPSDETTDIGNAPFVILQDMHSASMGELTGYACTLGIPSAVIIGERSTGATGMLIPDYPDLFHAGAANYNNKGDEPYVYTSTFSSKLYIRSDKEWRSIEGIGIEPDIYCPLDYAGLAAGGRDTQLDRAVKYILDSCGNQ